MNLQWADRLYRLFLLAYPAAFRREYGRDMAQLFRDTCRDAYRRSSTLSIRGVWIPALTDLVRTAMKERVLALTSAGTMEDVRSATMVKGALIGAPLGAIMGATGPSSPGNQAIGVLTVSMIISLTSEHRPSSSSNDIPLRSAGVFTLSMIFAISRHPPVHFSGEGQGRPSGHRRTG